MPTPFVVLVDDREQLPYTFANLRSDVAEGRQPLAVTAKRLCLVSGDYSLEGHADHITVERKSLEDLYHTLGQERRRFKREVERLAAMRYAAVVIEADWRTILDSPPTYSQLSPKIVYRTVLAWQLEFPSVHWWACTNRRLAEITTFRLLERYWKYHRGDFDLPVSPPECDSVSHRRSFSSSNEVSS